MGKRAISSVGLERLPYTQEVIGSNPISPTGRWGVDEIVSRVLRVFNMLDIGGLNILDVSAHSIGFLGL